MEQPAPPPKPRDKSARVIAVALSVLLLAIALLLAFGPLPYAWHLPLVLFSLCMLVALVILQDWRWAAVVFALFAAIHTDWTQFASENLHCGRAALRGPARAGDAKAQYDLGMSYLHCTYASGAETLVDEDPKEAEEWLLAAASAGYVPAQEELGQIYFESAPAKSAQWFLKAAQAGDAGAQFNMARYYDTGVPAAGGMPAIAPDAEAAYFWSLLAERGGVDVSGLYAGLGDKLPPETRADVEERVRDWKPAPP